MTTNAPQNSQLMFSWKSVWDYHNKATQMTGKGIVLDVIIMAVLDRNNDMIYK